jgi:hypothetical protein
MLGFNVSVVLCSPGPASQQKYEFGDIDCSGVFGELFDDKELDV